MVTPSKVQLLNYGGCQMRKTINLSVNARICLIHRYWCGAERTTLGMDFGLGIRRQRLHRAIQDSGRALDVWQAIHPGPRHPWQTNLSYPVTPTPGIVTYGQFGGFINQRSVK